MRTSEAGAFVEYEFNGHGIAWIVSKERTWRLADVYVDGKLAASNVNFRNFHNGPSAQQILFSIDGLADGLHKIKLVEVEDRTLQWGRENPQPVVNVAFDAFKVLHNNPPGDVLLIINNRWNYAYGLGLGNYVKEPVVIGSQYSNQVKFQLKEAKR